MNYTHFENVDELISDVQKIIAYRDPLRDKIVPNTLTGVKKILNIWEKNKAKIRKNIFQNSIVMEFGEISLKLQQEEKKALSTIFIKKLRDNWSTMFPDWAEYWEEGEQLSIFLNYNLDELFSNKTTHNYIAPDGTEILANSKISKSFKYFFDNSDLIRDVQDRFSTLIQQDKITGTLCASIHPLDYLSSSENNYKWRSCHALDGDYAGGNMSYMMDECTIMFYLKGADDVKLPRFPDDVLWNDKKWRLLVFIHPQQRIIWAGRQYPFYSQTLEDKCLNILNKSGYKFPKWSSNYFDKFMMPISLEEKPLREEYIYENGYLLTRKQLIQDVPFSTHYDDLLYSSYCLPKYCFNKNYRIDLDDLPKITVGHIPVCACCGKEVGLCTNEFICTECKIKLNPPLCARCSQPMFNTKDMQWYSELGMICTNCEEKYTVECEECGRRHLKSTNCLYCNPIFEDILYDRTLN